MIKLYKIKYTISPKGLNPTYLRYLRSAIVMRMLLEERGITGTRTSDGGLLYEVLMVVKDGIPVEQFLLESIPPLPTSTLLKVESIEALGHPAQFN